MPREVATIHASLFLPGAGEIMNPLSQLPSVDRLLSAAAISTLIDLHGRAVVTAMAREVLAATREAFRQGAALPGQTIVIMASAPERGARQVKIRPGAARGVRPPLLLTRKHPAARLNPCSIRSSASRCRLHATARTFQTARRPGRSRTAFAMRGNASEWPRAPCSHRHGAPHDRTRYGASCRWHNGTGTRRST